MRTINAVKAAIVWVPPLTRAPLLQHQASIGIVSRNKVILTYRYFAGSYFTPLPSPVRRTSLLISLLCCSGVKRRKKKETKMMFTPRTPRLLP